MDPDVGTFAQVMTVIVVTTASFIAIGLGTRVLWRMGSRPRAKSLPAADDARLERLEIAVETIAVEVERISEAQRFTAGLLAERLPARGERGGELPAASAAKRTNTPH
ncbi:MAG TPA: hypothetical protein VFZ11_14700 [Gemmatimonadaceae bacterium]